MTSKSDIYYERTFDFIDRLRNLENYEDICNELIDELEWYGLTCVTSLKIPSPGEDLSDTIVINNRPEEYVKHYSDNAYIFKDPVVTELKETLDTYSWDDILERRKLTKSQKSIIYEASEFGVTNGLVIPLVTDRGIAAIFCPCGEDPNLSSRARSALELIGIYSHQALQRALVRRNQSKQTHKPLTSREREIMHWVAIGKTDDEIGEILNISSTTVSSHIENSKKKLNAYKRTFAIVQAIRFGEITI